MTIQQIAARLCAQAPYFYQIIEYDGVMGVLFIDEYDLHKDFFVAFERLAYRRDMGLFIYDDFPDEINEASEY